MYAIRYKPTGQYTNLTFKGIDAINLGINPKIYTKMEEAEKELSMIESAIDHNRKANANGRFEFERHLRELEKRQEEKVHPTRTKNIKWYMAKLETIKKQEATTEQLRAEDFDVVAI